MGHNRRRIHYGRRFVSTVVFSLIMGALTYFAVIHVPFFQGVEARILNLAASFSGHADVKFLAVDREMFITRANDGYDNSSQQISHILTTPESKEVFGSYPLEPIHISVILKDLKSHGVKHIAMTQPVGWDVADSLVRVSLQNDLKGFERSTLGVGLKLSATPKKMPSALRRSSLPIHNDMPESLIEVNSLSPNEAYLGTGFSLMGFVSLTEEQNAPLPVLSRWGDRVVFSLPFLSLLQSYEIALGEVQVRSREIQVGDVLVIPINAQGRVGEGLPKKNVVFPPRIAVGDLVAPDENSPPYNTQNASALLSDIRQTVETDFNTIVSQATFFYAKTKTSVLSSFVLLIILCLLLGVHEFIRRSFSWIFVCLVSLVTVWITIYCAVSAMIMLPLCSALSAIFAVIFLYMMNPPLNKPSSIY